MEKLKFDSGIKCYRLGSGVLRCNPTDPNLYARFLQALQEVTAMEEELTAQAKDVSGEGVIRLLSDADARIKDILNRVFGLDNDFSKILEGVNLMAVGSNGERLITNLFAALEPVLTEGAMACARAEAQKL